MIDHYSSVTNSLLTSSPQTTRNPVNERVFLFCRSEQIRKPSART